MLYMKDFSRETLINMDSTRLSLRLVLMKHALIQIYMGMSLGTIEAMAVNPAQI